MKIIGIDPGLKGAIALITPGGVTLYDTPLAGDDYNIPAMARILWEASPDMAVLEKVHSMPKQGVASSFKFGVGYGIWKGVLGALGIGVHLIPPQTWKKQFSLISKPKDDSRLRAIELFPELEPELRLKKDCDRAEALLMAYWGVINLEARKS